MKNSLAGLTVVITRPAHQAKKLGDAIIQCGGNAILFPVIEIAPSESIDEAKKTLAHLSEFNWIIFISANAVDYALPLIESVYASWPSHTKVAAIGKATTEVLQNKNIPVDFFPETLFNSETLLAASEFQNIARQKIIIVRGEGGRGLLSDTLKSRGVIVEEAIVYQRTIPKNFSVCNLRESEFDIIVCTSNNGLENLLIMMGDVNRDWLLNKKLLVISDRMQNFANALGFENIEVTQNASNESILSSLHIL